MSVVTSEVITQIARLARLRLEGDALSRFALQLDEILQHVHRLRSVPTDGVEPTSHVLPLSNVLRKDEPRPSLSQEAVVALAPAAQMPFIKVPKIIET